jgi:hypothetical protein
MEDTKIDAGCRWLYKQSMILMLGIISIAISCGAAFSLIFLFSLMISFNSLYVSGSLFLLFVLIYFSGNYIWKNIMNEEDL